MRSCTGLGRGTCYCEPGRQRCWHSNWPAANDDAFLADARFKVLVYDPFDSDDQAVASAASGVSSDASWLRNFSKRKKPAASCHNLSSLEYTHGAHPGSI